MQITNEVIKEVTAAANKVCKGRYNLKEDVIQETILKLMNITTYIEKSAAGYIYIATLNTYVELVRRMCLRTKREAGFAHTQVLDVHHNQDSLVVRDYHKLLEVFKDEPAKAKVLRLLIDHPDQTYTQLALDNGIHKDTFKANIRHIQKKLSHVEKNYKNI